jgi:uncharacterized YigZ family protein
MNCVESRHTREDSIKKSRFIAVIVPCANEQEVLFTLKQLHEAHPNASHIVYAYRLKTEQGLSYRFHDAGEPSGTAGKPIFQHLEGKQLVNLLLAVIRYFGGIKLGAGGLTRAYSTIAKQVIDEAVISPYIDWVTVNLTLDYKQMQALEYLLKKWEGQIVEQDFAGQIRLVITLPEPQLSALLQAFPEAY